MKLNSIFTHTPFIRHVFTQITENIEKLESTHASYLFLEPRTLS